MKPRKNPFRGRPEAGTSAPSSADQGRSDRGSVIIYCQPQIEGYTTLPEGGMSITSQSGYRRYFNLY